MKWRDCVIDSLTRIRNSRLLWDAMGSIYNRRIYNAIAGLYDFAADRMPLPAEARLIDAGCGRGYIALQLAMKNPDAQVTGIDFSLMQVREARKFQKSRKISNCVFERGNAMNIRFEENTFDAAVSIGSIKHWPDDVCGLGEIYRVLKPGGLLLISETDQDASDDDIRRFMDRFKVRFLPERLLFWGLRHVIFGRSYTQTSLADALGRAGFRNIEFLRVQDCPYVMAKAVKQA